MDGFRPWLERAIRVEAETIDWSQHTIDYAAFKRKLLQFSKRRSQLRHLLSLSDNDSILASELQEILGNTSTPVVSATPEQQGQSVSAAANAAANAAAETRTSTNPSITTTAAATTTPTHMNYVPMGDEAQLFQTSQASQPLQQPPPTRDSYQPPQQPQLQSQSQQEYHHSTYNRFFSDDAWLEADLASSCAGDGSISGGSMEGFGGAGVPRLLQMVTSEESTARVQNFWLKNRKKKPKRVKRRAVMRQVSNAERQDIEIFLAHEVDKVCMFYLAQWQNLLQQLVDYQTHQQELFSQQLGSTRTAAANHATILYLGREILELKAFCVINIVTIRQILIRYDAFARQFEGTPMLQYFMKDQLSYRNKSHQATSVKKILYHEELRALADAFATTCQENTTLHTKFQAQRLEFDDVLESSARAEAASSAGHVATTDTLLQTLRYYFLLGLMEDRLGYEPSYLTSRGKSLTEEMQAMAEWRHRGEEYLYQPIKEELTSLDGKQLFNLIMTLTAAFLYCMNYYIVEPSSTMYVNALGARDAMSGTLIGMMPIASFLAAIFYSLWTNYSFRKPFLLSCCLLLSGNILYSAALNFKSLEMALAGRFLTGLGGPKCIVRRYMADTTSMNLRTSVNAGFGMVVAAGSALGPGVAILLNKLNFVIPIPNGEIWLNGMTGPGYFMALLWTLFTIPLFINFTEPDRSGLEEQKRMERAKGLASPRGVTPGGGPGAAVGGGETAENDSIARTDSNKSQDMAESSTAGTDTPSSKNGPVSRDDDLLTIFSGATQTTYQEEFLRETSGIYSGFSSEVQRFFHLVTFPVRICLGLLFAKVFVIETLVSATSSLTKNRYGWQVLEVGTLGCVNGLTVIPLSVLIGRLSMSYQDRVLMTWLLSIGIFGLFLLIDISDLIDSYSKHYNEGDWLAVGPHRYVIGYFLVYISIQSFEGVIGSALSKVIPTALASGTLNSGLLATLVDTFGRSCGDLFISLVGFINLRQLMNLLFIPGATILIICLMVVQRYYDILAV